MRHQHWETQILFSALCVSTGLPPSPLPPACACICRHAHTKALFKSAALCTARFWGANQDPALSLAPCSGVVLHQSQALSSASKPVHMTKRGTEGGGGRQGQHSFCVSSQASHSCVVMLKMRVNAANLRPTRPCLPHRCLRTRDKHCKQNNFVSTANNGSVHWFFVFVWCSFSLPNLALFLARHGFRRISVPKPSARTNPIAAPCPEATSPETCVHVI